MRKRDKNLAIGAVVAAGVGYAIGILTAPKSGKETRQDIKEGAVKAKQEAEKHLKRLSGDISLLIEDATAQLKRLSGVAKTELSEAISKAKTAKEKARQVLSAFHEGEADDADLDKAVKQVKQATENLKKFVNKNA
jgi:gas vesicle protein